MAELDQVLAFFPESLGIQKGIMELGRLYPEARDRAAFEDKWPRFLSSDPLLREVVWRTGTDRLCFLTESLLPAATDDRPPALLVVGNPAPHSVLNRLPFSFEANHREHRFWSALGEAGFLNFGANQIGTMSERNQERKEAMYALRYRSPFRLGIAVYFSMPSPAVAPPWAGVAGIRKLFGGMALRIIAHAEEERLAQVIREFNAGTGAVIAFQKDAYDGIRSPADAPYSVRTALHSILEGTCKFDARIPLVCAPPTRLMRSVAARATLARIKARLIQAF